MGCRVAFIVPPPEATTLRFVSYQQPINLAYLAAEVVKAGHNAVIWDYGVEEYTPQYLIDRLSVFRPDVVGIHCKTFSIIQGYELATEIKKKYPHMLIVVGGPHSTALPEETLREFDSFDVVVVGEGERTIVDICEHIAKGKSLQEIMGVAIRDGLKIKRNTGRGLIHDLDTLSYPARNLLLADLYKKGHASRGLSSRERKVTEIFTSRGCPGQCIFCGVRLSYGNCVRFRSVNNVLGEVDECINKFSYDHIVIQDDTFTLKRKRVSGLLDGFRKLGVKSWSCDTRVDAVDKELFNEMAHSNCKKVSLGVESGSEKILKMIKKNINLDQVRNAVRWARASGIELVECTFIIGSHPDETREDVSLTWNMIKELSPDIISVSVIVPYPGTEVYELMKKRGYIYKQDWGNFQMIGRRLTWRTKYFSSGELLRLQRQFINKYYFNLKYIVRSLRKVRDIDDLKYLFKMGLGVLQFLLKKN